MSVSLAAERDRIQRQVEELEQSLSVTHTELELLSSGTDDESDGDDTEEEVVQSAAGLLAQREKIQKDIQNLENILGPHSPTCVSDDDGSSSEESELGLPLSVDSCLQMNLVYQQVVQETLDQLETLLTHNQRQQKEVVSQLSGPIKEPSREQRAPSSCQQPANMFLGRFLKPYFKDKLTGLGPPANQETKEKASRMTGCLDNKKLKLKRWESWQKTLLIHSIARDNLRRLIQPKLSKVDYLSQKLSSAQEADKEQLRQQIESLEREIELLKGKKEEELIGERYDEHDWQKIYNIDFEGTRDAEDIRSFWQNFLHPSINKSRWSKEEVQQLKEVSRKHGERHWETIAAELGTGRTAFLCLQTFQRFVSGSLRHGTWTPAEDNLLRELVDKMRIGNFIPYTQMSYFMQGRDPAQLIYRWNQVLDPSLKRGMWTKQEDQLLLKAVSAYGEKNWWKIRLEVPGRTDSACRDRYHDCLRADIKRGPFDEQEKELLRQLVAKHGVGRWAKIAAEIPNRYDAQCLREWRKLNKPAPPQKSIKAEKPPTSCAGVKKKAAPAKKRIRKRLIKLEEEEEEETREEEEMVVEYMDSDDEEKKKKKKEVVEVDRIEEVQEEEEEEEEYTFPPMQEWTPAEKSQCLAFLNFRPVELPSSGDARNGKLVRSTILGRFGRSVIIGPQPREVQWERSHSSSTMMMVTPDQLRAQLSRQGLKSNSPSSGPKRKTQTDKRNHVGRVTDTVLGYELQSAVIPWIGNLLIPATNRLTAADALRERGEKTRLSSTSIFLLFLQTMNVDSVGCKEMIEQRRNRVVLPSSPPDLYSVQTKTPKTVAKVLQQREVKRELQELDLQHELILKQLQVLQQQQKQKWQQPLIKQHFRPQQPQQLMLLHQSPASPRAATMPLQNRPGIFLQMSPNVHPRMSPMSFPRAVFIPHPVTQPCTASIQLMPPSSLTTSHPAQHRQPPAGDVTSPLPAPPAHQRLNAPAVSVVPMPLNATSTCSPSLGKQAAPLTQNLIVALSTSPNQHVPVGSTLPSQHAVSSNSSSTVPCPTQPCPAPSPSASILNIPKGRRQRVAGDQKVVCSSQNGVDLAGTSKGVGGACDSVIEEGRRIRKPSNKAKALQEATDAKAKAKTKASPSPRKKAQTQKPNSPPHQVCTETPVQLVPQTPPSSLAMPNDHDYTFRSPGPTPSHHGSDSIQPSPAPKQPNTKRCKSNSAPKKPRKAPPRGRKQGRGKEQPSVKTSQVDQCVAGTGDIVAGTGDIVAGTGTGAIQEGKRARKPSQRARALQEDTQAKAEAKKKRTSSSSPRKKRSRTSRLEEEVVQNPQVTQFPSLCLHPGQSMWVMTPGGLVQLAEATSKDMHLALVPSTPVPAPPGNILNSQSAKPPLQLTAGSSQSSTPQPPTVSVPVNLPGRNKPRLLPAPTTCSSKSLPTSFILQPNPSVSHLPPPKRFLPYKGTVRVDPAAPPPLRREPLQFDPSLMFLESRAEVCDWLSGRGGVVVPGVGVALPYLPPFISSLSTLSALLQAKKSLTKSSLQLLCRGSEPRHSQTKPKSESSTKRTSSQPPDLPDSTSDFRPTADEPAPSVSSDPLLQEVEGEEDEEVELVVAVRQLVAERFSDNATYQLLKARFLSCFTVPAVLATVQPITEKTLACPTNEDDEEKEEEKEEEDEEEVELKKIKERGRQRRAKRSLLCDGPGAPANHFSGIISTNTPTTDQTGLDQTGPDGSGRSQTVNVQ